MSDTLDIQFDPKTIPNRSEIRKYLKNRLVQEKMANCISKISSKVLHNAQIWLDGFVIGVGSNTFKEPIDNFELKEFYLDNLFNHYIKDKI